MNLAFIAAMLGTGGSGPGRRPPRRPTGGQRPGRTTPGGPGGTRTNTRLNSYLNRTPQFKSIQNKYGYEAPSSSNQEEIKAEVSLVLSMMLEVDSNLFHLPVVEPTYCCSYWRITQ